jgi:hypothetical protein
MTLQAGYVPALTIVKLAATYRRKAKRSTMGGYIENRARRVGSLYLPNGQSGTGPEFKYKLQAASDSGNADAFVFFLFDLLFLNGEDLTGLPCRNGSRGSPQ